jgi:hypothetical protein
MYQTNNGHHIWCNRDPATNAEMCDMCKSLKEKYSENCSPEELAKKTFSKCYTNRLKEIKINGFSIEEWIDDFKLKVAIIKWTVEDKKIKALELKLKDLRSED